jgi:hypothetical protein
MPIRNVSRRQLLVGASGFCLGLPVLRSLLPRDVKAAPSMERRFVAFASDHGGVDESAMFPADSQLTSTMNLYTGHDVRRGNLVRSVDGDVASLSEVLRGPADRLSASLVSKMNVIRGMDIPWYIAHHTGGHLGNYARNDGNGEDGAAVQASPMPSIDQIMAWSSNFYSNLSGVTERAMVFGANRLSYNWSSPSDRSGDIQQVSGSDNPLTMFNRVFIPEEDPAQPEPRPPIVDRVFTSYQSLRQSDQRLSTEDKQRLDDHMDRLAELERRLNVDAVRRASCGSSPAPMGDRFDVRDYYHMVNDVIVTAFLCGTSRIAVVKIEEARFTDYAGDWHQDIAHQHTLPQPQARLREVNQQAFEHAVLDLAYKLDVEEAPDQNVLDSCIVQWTQESGSITHDARSMPLITFGAASGNLNTGNYCDYVKRTPQGIVYAWGSGIGQSGLLYSQWLAQAMQAVGVEKSEFQGIAHNGAAGYGYPYVDEGYDATHSTGVVENASEPLPFLG